MLLFSERMSLSIRGKNTRQEALINMFMLTVPISFLYKICSIVFIYSNFTKFEAIKEVQEFFENDILYNTFHNVAIYTGVVF